MPNIPNNFMSGASHNVPGTGRPWIGSILEGLTGLTLDEAKAYPAADRTDMSGQIIVIDGFPWQISETSELTADDVLIAEFDEGDGRLLRMPGFCELSFDFTFATADAAVLYTMPTGAYFVPLDFYWSVTTPFTGGSSSAIGVSTTKSGMTTKGDLLGGAAGDVEATLIEGSHILGTIGAKWDAVSERRQIWAPTEIFRHDHITSVFTAGEGAVKVYGILLANAGA